MGWGMGDGWVAMAGLERETGHLRRGGARLKHSYGSDYFVFLYFCPPCHLDCWLCFFLDVGSELFLFLLFILTGLCFPAAGGLIVISYACIAWPRSSWAKDRQYREGQWNRREVLLFAWESLIVRARR